MLSRIGQNLTSILTGKTEPLGLMLEDDLLYQFYAGESTNRCYGYLSRYIRYLSFKNPRMRILEIGAGTGSTTIPVLTALNAEGASRVDDYHFTDISAGFFDKARVLLAEWTASVACIITTWSSHQMFSMQLVVSRRFCRTSAGF